MTTSILTTKLYIPPPPPQLVDRPRLRDRLSANTHRKLTLISAPAGFGKTTLVSEWLANEARPVAWLSLDEQDSDPVRFLYYLVTALQEVAPQLGEDVLHLLQQAPQPPPTDLLLTTLLNQIAALSEPFMFVLDDYHVLDNSEIHTALTFLVEHQPPGMHLVITTREDPPLPLARLRARGALVEIRAADLRFTAEETAHFLNEAMGLTLSTDDIDALEQRTEGWIAGLQLAALSLQGAQHPADFITTFSGSHHFVLDYLAGEVLNQQPEHVQRFLLQTSMLDRMCGPLCDTVLENGAPPAQTTLEHLQRANLFLVPLDNERRWYRYHHLFGDLLHKRLHQSSGFDVTGLHQRASAWYKANGYRLEAFQHAAAAGDVDRAAALVNDARVPLYFRGAARPVLNWLESLPDDVLDASPSLWVTYAWVLMAVHRSTQIEPKLRAAETALTTLEADDPIRDLLGNIAAIRAMEAAIHYDTETIFDQAQRALDLLSPENLTVRTAATRSLAIGYQYLGEREAAKQAYLDAIAMSEASDNRFMSILATTGLGIIQMADTQLHAAYATFQKVLTLVSNPEGPMGCVAYLRMARIQYEWNNLDTARAFGEQGVRLARQIESIDSGAGGEIFLARLELAAGNVTQAATRLDNAAQEIHRRGFTQQEPVVAAAQVQLYLHQGNLAAAERAASRHDLPLSRARVLLAQGEPDEVLTVLRAYRQHMEAKSWHEEHLETLVFEALAHWQAGETDTALATIEEALAAAAPDGFMRTFLDAGGPMTHLLTEAAAHGIEPEYTQTLLAAFAAQPNNHLSTSQPLIEPLSERELEVLHLVAQGLSNREISERLFISINTVKGHNRVIFEKLSVNRRTEAVARARELGVLSDR